MKKNKHWICWKFLFIALSVASALRATTAIASDLGQSKSNGQQLAIRLCGSCHAVDMSSNSPRSDAPAFRVFAERYSVWDLQEALAEGIVVGHPDMPQFVLTSDEIGDLLRYMDGLNRRK
jgi:mono/diheme cytochrome c family protein